MQMRSFRQLFLVLYNNILVKFRAYSYKIVASVCCYLPLRISKRKSSGENTRIQKSCLKRQFQPQPTKLWLHESYQKEMLTFFKIKILIVIHVEIFSADRSRKEESGNNDGKNTDYCKYFNVFKSLIRIELIHHQDKKNFHSYSIQQQTFLLFL